MNEVILEAAVRVLRRQGATGFTTTRVAEVAGISVGSLYQYYPNKASLLFRIHEQEDERTWGEIEGILEEVETPPRERVVRAIDQFFETETAEAELRRALQGSNPTPGQKAQLIAVTCRVPGQRLYLSAERPTALASLVIDNADPENPRIVPAL
jgi:AcrR family transcriptional regulator